MIEIKQSFRFKELDRNILLETFLNLLGTASLKHSVKVSSVRYYAITYTLVLVFKYTEK